MGSLEFFDDDAVIRLGEAILSQLQQDYVGAYATLLKDGPDKVVYRYGSGPRMTASYAVKEMEGDIHRSSMTAEYADSIIEELRRQAREIAETGKTAKKVNWRPKVWSRKETANEDQ